MEYVGAYDLRSIYTLLDQVKANPYIPIKRDTIQTVDYKANRSADSTMAKDLPYTKVHKKIVMLSEAPANDGVSSSAGQIRYKFDSSFTGRVAKGQRLPPQSAADRSRRVYAEDAHLESDERDIMGRFLHSERNMEILSATRKAREGVSEKRVHGFYLNDEFYTDETDNTAGTRLSGKNDMGYFSVNGREDTGLTAIVGRSWEKPRLEDGIQRRRVR